jgi:hypothetical protein
MGGEAVLLSSAGAKHLVIGVRQLSGVLHRLVASIRPGGSPTRGIRLSPVSDAWLRLHDIEHHKRHSDM